jgi:hypothetical protein
MNPSEMTDQELNEAIAVKRGWVNYDWSLKYTLPNYLADGNLTVQLLEEMPVQTRLINYEDEGNGKEFWTCLITNLFNGREVAYTTAGTFGRAVAEAWLAVFGGEG